jgi:RimJ/RimL family protein N-acetyltransferase
MKRDIARRVNLPQSDGQVLAAATPACMRGWFLLRCTKLLVSLVGFAASYCRLHKCGFKPLEPESRWSNLKLSALSSQFQGLPTMPEVVNFSSVEALRDGRRVEIRALRHEDCNGLEEAVSRASDESVRRRFFSVRHHLSEQEIEFFSNIDFVSHVALVVVAVEGEEPHIVGSGRYIVVEPARAEIAFALVDEYQGQGIGAVLMRHLATIARDAGLKEFIAEVLPENTAMLKVFKKSGLHPTIRPEAGIVHVTLRLS